MPHCFKISFAVWRDFIFPSTVTLRLVMGLYQMSWSSLPHRTKLQPFADKISRTFFSYSAIGKGHAFIAVTEKMHYVFFVRAVQLDDFGSRQKNFLNQFVCRFVFKYQPWYIVACGYLNASLAVPRKNNSYSIVKISSVRSNIQFGKELFVQDGQRDFKVVMRQKIFNGTHGDI